MFTYDMGHEIIDYGHIIDLTEVEISRINNVHLHTFIYGKDHQLVYPNSNNKQTIIKCILYLKNINYNGPIVYEYDLDAAYGNDTYEKLETFIKSMEYISEYYK